MENRKAEGDAALDETFQEVATNDEMTKRLLAIDEWTRTGEITEPLRSDEQLASESASFADCLQLIERVRQFHPDCMADMQLEDTQHTSWLEGIGECPAQFGRFRILRQLGEGGFGLVFLALDPNLEREVALKLPRIATLVTELTQQRFLREAKAAAALDHRNIAAVHESGRVGPVCYIASAYYAGGTLADFLQRHGPIHPQQSASIVAALADAAQYAHSRGILHRDLKPGNVLLDVPSGSGTPTPAALRVSDFGLARILDDDTHATQTGALMGTPAYMSPEQADSRLDQVSTASDIYALGAILYELLTGRPPFEGTALEVLEAVRSREPVLPSRLRKDVPRDLEAICLKCLEKSPAQRYATANSLSQDLNRWLAGKPISARSISQSERVLRWCRRNPALSAVSGIAAVALLAGSLASTVLWLKAERHAAQAESRSRQLTEVVDNLNSAIDMLFVTVAESDELRSYDAEPLRQKLLEQAQKYYQLVASYRPVDAEVGFNYAETLFRLGLVHKQLGDTDRAEQIFTEAIRALSKIPGSIDRTVCEVQWSARRAQVLDQMGRHDEARQVQSEAIQIARRAAEQKGLRRKELQITEALLWSDVAGGELIESDLKAAGAAAATSLRLWRELLDTMGIAPRAREVLGYATSLWTLGISEEETGKLTEAEGHLRDAVTFLQDHQCTRENVDLMMLLGRAQKKLGIALAKQDRLDDAREVYLAAISCFEELVRRHPRVPEFHMELCSSRYSLSVTQYLAGNHEQTLSLLQANVDDYATLAEIHPDQRVNYWNRAGVASNMLYEVYRDLGKTERASESIRRSLDYYKAVESERPNWTFNQILLAECETNLALLMAESDELHEVPLWIESAKSRVQPIVSEQPNHDRALRALYGAHNSLAEFQLRQDNLDDARRENDAALQLMEGAAAWESILRNALLLAREQDFDEANNALDGFLNQAASSQKHYLGVARCAAKIRALIAEDQPSIRDSIHVLGTVAIRRAAPDSETELAAFRETVAEDPLLNIFQAE